MKRPKSKFKKGDVVKGIHTQDGSTFEVRNVEWSDSLQMYFYQFTEGGYWLKESLFTASQNIGPSASSRMSSLRIRLATILFRAEHLIAKAILWLRGDDYFICEACLAVTHQDCLGDYYNDITTCGNCSIAGRYEKRGTKEAV